MTHENIERRRTRITERLRDIQGVQAALKEAARRAVREHARAGRRSLLPRDPRTLAPPPSKCS